MSRRQKRRAMKQFLRELPPMIVIGIGLICLGAASQYGGTMRSNGVIAVLILAGLIILSATIDRKVEAAERREELERQHSK